MKLALTTFRVVSCNSGLVRKQIKLFTLSIRRKWRQQQERMKKPTSSQLISAKQVPPLELKLAKTLMLIKKAIN
jgi:hypothetical protein